MEPYAIIQTGSKQYTVSKGDVIDIEQIKDISSGQDILFQEVLFIFDGSKASLGAPVVENAVVKGQVISQVRGEKVVAYKYKRRKNYHRKHGHRQNYFRVKISELVA